MTETPNHGYNRPPRGAKNWDEDLNQNFTDIDEDMPIRDTEGNKGNYDPVSGRKYEATDSGAVYYGNGDSWVLADREVGSVRAESVNNVLTPQDNTIQAIQDLVDNYVTPNIRLEPGVLYEGDTQLFIDVEGGGESGDKNREVYINAHSAGVNYTGNEKSAVKIVTGDPGNGQTRGGIEIQYGSWWGPDRSVSEGAVIRADDTFGAHIRPSECRRSEHGVLLVNKDRWCEGGEIGLRQSGFYQGEDAPNESPPKYYIRTVGGGSESFSETLNGTASCRDTDIIVPFHSANDESGAVTVWQNHSSHHGAFHKIRGFVPDGGAMYRIDGGGGFVKKTMVHFESEGGNSESVAVDLDTGSPPYFTGASRINSSGTDIQNSKGGLPFIIDSSGNGVGSAFSLKPRSEPSFDYRWLDLKDPNFGGKKFSLTNHKNEFTLYAWNDSRVRTADSNDDPIPVLASEHQSDGDAGTRSHLGKFDEHPSAENGDTWYITGSGSIGEGFYGQTDAGTVQFD